jgi:bifunctional DNase/RNase
MTHDLSSHIMTTLGAQLTRIEIHTFREGTFFASLTIEQSGVTFVVDARPSDAIALAVRQGAPLFIDEEVFEATAVKTNVITHVGAAGTETTAQAMAEIRNFAENVQPSDFSAN